MKQYSLAVVVREVEYARRMAEYVHDSPYKERWQITAFTHAGACRQYAAQGHAIDLIAAEAELYQELEDCLGHIPAVALVSKPATSGKEDSLLQYQPLPQLLQALSERHERSLGKQATQMASGHATQSRPRIVSVYSASGGTGKTALSLHLAHAAGSLGYRTFYLNLERWNTAEAWLDGRTSGNEEAAAEGLSELLYGIKAGTAQAGEWLLKHRRRHPLLKGDYLAACSNVEDRLTLEPGDAAAVIDVIIRSGQYDVIIVDLDDGLEELHAAVLERSDRILWMTAAHASVHRKQTVALRFGLQKWGERFERMLRRTEFVNNRVGSDSKPMKLEAAQPGIAPIALPDVGEWQRSEAATLLSSPSFRAAAGKLLRHVLGERNGERP